MPTTYTKDGRPKPTPVWGVPTRVAIQRCGALGKPLGKPVDAVARNLPESDTGDVYRAVVRRYWWHAWWFVPHSILRRAEEPRSVLRRWTDMRIRWMFVLYAVIEMAVIVALVATIGFGWTVLLLAGSFLLGLILAGAQVRRQVAVLSRGFREPGAQITDGALVALGSVLMIIPGLVTSVAGLMLLLPPTRTALRPLAGALATRTLAGRLAFVDLPLRGTARPAYIDGEVIDVQDVPDAPVPNLPVLRRGPE